MRNVIAGTGCFCGPQVGDASRGHDRSNHLVLRPGPPMFPMGERGDFQRGPGFAGPFGPGGPMVEMPRSPSGPGGSDDAPAPPRPCTAVPRMDLPAFGDTGTKAISYTHLPLPTIYPV